MSIDLLVTFVHEAAGHGRTATQCIEIVFTLDSLYAKCIWSDV